MIVEHPLALLEGFNDQAVRYRSKQRLFGWSAAAQGVEADAPTAYIDFTANQSMQPLTRNIEASAEQVRTASGIGAAQENQRTAQCRIGVELEMRRHGASCGCAFPARRTARTMRGHVAVGLALQVPRAVTMDTVPELGLPQAVETLNGVLKSRLTWRRKHRANAQRKAQSAYPADDLAVPVRALEDRIVVELRIGRQTVAAPALQQAFHRGFRTAAILRPRIDQATVQRGRREQVQQRTPGNLEVLDEIKTVQLCR